MKTPVLLAVLVMLQAPVARAAGDVQAGKAAFAAKCASCHQVGPSARHGFGPHLQGIAGRAAASSPEYAYSTALKRSGIVWTDASLAAFLRDPDALVPGTKMRFYLWGFNREKRVEDLVAYLRTVQ